MAPPRTPLSILDLALVGANESVGEALGASVTAAQAAERLGYRRVWYAEHHNMGSIASAATSVLIAHVAAHTKDILLGSGGIMLPNHSPLVIAEQFGTLASLHPGRIELGLGRAPGSDEATTYALRRAPEDASTFPRDVLELQAFLAEESRVEGVRAIPGRGTNVPITILGSSLFGAQLAAELGLPYGFASHFAPAALEQAVALYRRSFKPSPQLSAPHVLTAINVVVADSADAANAMREAVTRQRVALFLGRGRTFTDRELDEIIASPQGRQITAMMRHTAAGTARSVASQIDDFRDYSDADEVIVVFNGTTIDDRLRALEMLGAEYHSA